MKKLTFLALFACATLFAIAQTKPKTVSNTVTKEKSCKPGDACCKKKGDKKSCNMSEKEKTNHSKMSKK